MFKIYFLVFSLLIILLLILAKEHIKKDLLLSITVFAAISISYFIPVIFLTNGYHIELYNGIDTDVTSAVGTLLGGILTPVVSLISIILFVKNLQMQQKEIVRQNKLTENYYIERNNEPKLQIMKKCEHEIDNILKSIVYKKMMPNNIASVRTFKDILLEGKKSNDILYYHNESMTLAISVVNNMVEISDYLTIIINTIDSLEGNDKKEYIMFYYTKYFPVSFLLYDIKKFQCAYKFNINYESEGITFRTRMKKNKIIIESFLKSENAPF